MKQQSEVKRMQQIAGIKMEDAVGRSSSIEYLSQKFKEMGLTPGGTVYVAEAYPGFNDVEVKGQCMSFDDAVRHINDAFNFDDHQDSDEGPEDMINDYVQKFQGIGESELSNALDQYGLMGKVDFKLSVDNGEDSEDGVSYVGNCSGNLPSFDISGDGDDDDDY